MSQARKRGSYEQRVAQAIEKKETLARLERERVHQHALDVEAKRQAAYELELHCWKLMIWWQVEMSAERYEQYLHRKHKRDMANAQMLGTLASAFGTFMYHPRHRGGGIGRI